MKGAVIGTIMPWTGGLSNIPKGWIICDGSSLDGRDFPLLVQVIGDTYNVGASNLGGGFPAYSGQFVLPNLIEGRVLMDIEGDHFDPILGTGKPIDTDPDARLLIEPFISSNIDNGVPSVFNDVRTDVVFELNDRNGYSGNISGNTMEPKLPEEKPVFIGGRKLGHTHIRSHSHSGSYETLIDNNPTRPGLGVIPYDNITARFTFASIDERTIDPTGIFTGDGKVDKSRFGLKWYKDNLQLVSADTVPSFTGFSGFGGGSPGRTVMRMRTENPPINLSPQIVLGSTIANQADWTYGLNGLTSGDIIPYGLFGTNVTIPTGFRNYYPDALAAGYFGTFVSNVGSDWLDDSVQAHAHDPFTVAFDQNSLKPQSRLVADVNIPITTELDNATNVGALEISMNTSQPSVTIVYLIRAY